MNIEVLGFDGCPSVSATLEIVNEVLARLGESASVTYVEVDSIELAERVQFLGSPSVRINGIDVEPARQDEAGFAYSCRVYRDGETVSGIPSMKLIHDAILVALSIN